MDGDDAFLPHKVEAVVDTFLTDPEAVLVQHYFEVVDGENYSSGIKKPLLIFDPNRIGQDHLTYYQNTNSLFDLFAQTSALSFRRSYLEQRLPLPEDELNLIWPDVRLTRLAPFFGKVRQINACLSYYRIHGTNWIHELKDQSVVQKVREQMYRYFNEYKPDDSFPTLSLFAADQKRGFLLVTWLKRFLKMKASFYRFNFLLRKHSGPSTDS